MGAASGRFRRAQAEAGETFPGRGAHRSSSAHRGALVSRGGYAVEAVTLTGARDAHWQKRPVWVEKHGPVAEALRHLALRVRNELEARRTSSVLVVTCERDEGKTLTA